MTVIPDGGVPEEEKRPMPRVIYEGPEEVKLDGSERRPSGKSPDPNKVYFWKMSKDKRTIDVIIPIDEDVTSEDIIYRLGEDPFDPKRGPHLELGYRRKNADGRYKEHLVIDGQILNSINRKDSYWTLEEMADVPVCILTLTRPSMMRMKHDPVLKRSIEEERIEPQTWDALLVEERLVPEVTQRAYFDLTLDGEPGGRLEIGLYGNVVPKTVKNFVGLITGEYVDDEGRMQKSAHCLKGSKFKNILHEFLIEAGNPGLDLVLVHFDAEELKEYSKFYEDFRMQPKKIGKVEETWTIRWGADLGLPVDEDGKRKEEGSPVDGNSESELAIITEAMRVLNEKGEGAKFIFYRSEYAKGCDVTGGTFPAENFKVPHSRPGLLTMDRSEDKDEQGSVFFFTLREFPEMDGRWVVFGEVLQGMDLLTTIEEDFEGRANGVVIEDCGLLHD